METQNRTLDIYTAERAASIDVDKRTAQFVISDGSIDRHGTVISIDGWSLDNYMQNPVVCYNHHKSNDNPDTIIGTSRVWIEEDKLIGEVTFEDKADNELADKVFRKVQAGILRMSSVGFLPIAWRWGDKEKNEDPSILHFTKQELLEWSIVSVPSNAKAKIRSTEDYTTFKASVARSADLQEFIIDPYVSRSQYLNLIKRTHT